MPELTGYSVVSFSVKGKELTDKEVEDIQSTLQMKDIYGKIVLVWDSSVTDDGSKATLIKVQFRFAYSDMSNFMDTLKNLLGKISLLGQEVSSHGKKGHRKPETNIVLQFELPDKSWWNECAKSSLQAASKDKPFFITSCKFGRRMNSYDVITKYLHVTLKLSDFEKNLVFAVVHVVSTFELRRFQQMLSSRKSSILSGSNLSAMLSSFGDQQFRDDNLVDATDDEIETEINFNVITPHVIAPADAIYFCDPPFE